MAYLSPEAAKNLGLDEEPVQYLSEAQSKALGLDDAPSSESPAPQQPDLAKQWIATASQDFKKGLSTFSQPIPGAGPALGAASGLALSGMNPIGGVGGWYAGKQVERGLQGKIGTPSDQIGDLNEGMLQEVFGGLFNLGKDKIAKLAPEIMQRINLARDTDVDLSPATIKGTKGLAQVESFLDKNITSSTTARQAYKKTLDQTAKFAQTVQGKFGGKATMLDAGEKAQTMAKGRYGAFMAKAQQLYKAIPVIPDTPVETNQLRDTAIGMMDELGKIESPAMKRILNIAKESAESQIQYRPGTPDAQVTISRGSMTPTTLNIGRGRQVTLDPTAQVTYTPAGQGGIVDASGNPFVGAKMPTYTWQELISDRNALNQMWRQSSDPNRKRLIGKLVDAIDDDIAKFSEFNPDIKTSFDKALKFYKFGDESLPGVPTFRDRQIKQVLTTSSPEDLTNKFIKPNNVSDIKRLVAASGPEGMQPVKQAWLGKLLTKGEEQSFSPAKFATAFEKYDIETLKAFLKPEEIAGLKKLADISRLVNKAEEIAGNPPGTAQNVLTGGWLASFVRRPILTTATALGSNKFAKLYFENPKFRRSLIHGAKLSPTSREALNAASRLSAIADIESGQGE